MKLLILFAVLLTGCSGKLPDDSLLDSASATIQVGGGHGPPWSYDLTIKGDGSEIFHGGGTLLYNDTELGHIPREDARTLFREFIAKGFNYLSNQYGMILGGHTIITFTFDRKTKTVWDRGHAPQELKAVERAFDSIGRVVRWTGTVDDYWKIMHTANSAYFPGKDSLKQVVDSLEKEIWIVTKGWDPHNRQKWEDENFYPIANRYALLDREAQKAPVDSTRKALQAIYARLNFRQIDSIARVRNAARDSALNQE
jgi:hypothetical protein